MVALLTLFWLHVLADFFLQSRWMAVNKSKDNWPLTVHAAVYSSVFMGVFGWKYALINGALHWLTDWASSRGTTLYYGRGRMHEFFAVIGVDQGIHLTCLAVTAQKFGIIHLV
jgi:hypothetical protein